MRVGIGYDVHQLVEGRQLIIGGVLIPYSKGLLGHSDADVLTHAIIDALLGAANLKDIGFHFPDNLKEFEGISSLLLLKKTRDAINAKGYSVANVDTIIVAQEPKMSTFIDKMAANIAVTLEISIDQVNVKATTTEGLGYEGQGYGIASYAIVLLSSI